MPIAEWINIFTLSLVEETGYLIGILLIQSQ